MQLRNFSMNRIFTHILFSCIMAFIIMIPICRFFQNESIGIEFVVEEEKDIEYQLFYLDSTVHEFNEAMSIKEKAEIKNGEKFIRFRLPIKELCALRLDIGENPGRVVLKNFKISGKNEINLIGNDIQKSFFNDINQEKIENGYITLISNEIDPFIIFPNNLIYNTSKIIYEWYPLISIYILLSIIFIVFGRYIIKLKKDNSYIDMFFLLVISIVLILPITKIDKREIDLEENRSLALKPTVIVENKFNYDYGKKFESWLNDRFRYRNKLMNLHDSLETFIEGRAENSRAFVGRNNWIFYKGEDSINLYQNKSIFNNEEMEKIKNNLNSRKKWLNANGIEFFVFIAPDKNSVYGEFYKEGIRKKGDKNRIEILKNYLDYHGSEVKINYPLENLLEHKTDGLLYWKTDTHWNEYGAYIGYLELMKNIQAKFPEIQILPLDCFNIEYTIHPNGDLTKMLKINDSGVYNDDMYISLKPKNGYHFQYIKNEGTNGIITYNPDKKLKVLVFRDSFAESMQPYLSESFGYVEYIWKHDINSYQEKIIEDKPDIVIHEMVGRAAICLLQDKPVFKEVKK